jgi:hypothetical protein
MFQSFNSSSKEQRLNREREIWVERRQKTGKKMFLFSNAVVLSNGCFVLLRLPILCHFWYGQNITHHGKVIALFVMLPISIGVGVFASIGMWRRGERIVATTAE